MPLLDILGVKIKFPYPPYECQVNYMKSVITALEKVLPFVKVFLMLYRVVMHCLKVQLEQAKPFAYCARVLHGKNNNALNHLISGLFLYYIQVERINSFLKP